jgi:DNA-binding transcriptional MerR regulator/tetratricopeptide (TPR) repeat protein
MRMAELAARSGVPRETIHFYLREGLLPRPRKAGQTVAYYDEGHLERLRLVRRLREEKYLPIAVIRRLLASPAAAAERDIDALAEVLHIVPGLGAEARHGKQPEASAEAVRVAEELGLLGVRPAPRGAEGARDEEGDLTARRVLSIVEDALALKGAARALTLEDLSVCAADLTGLVAREAEIFFDAVFRSGDLGGSIAALREGRGVVARFITAYRDRMLRRIIDDLLVAIERGPEVAAQARTVPLSGPKLADLGALELRADLRRAALGEGDPAAKSRAAARLAWHLFACGDGAELAALGDEAAGLLVGEREAVLVAWGAHERSRSPGSLRALERAADAAPDFGLGEILLGEAALVRALRRRDAGAGLLEEAVPALHRLVGGDPEGTDSLLERALSFFHRGRVELALPSVLGRRRRGSEVLERALAMMAPGNIPELDAAARAVLSANARLALGRCSAEAGHRSQARAHFEEAARVDPEGPIGAVARGEIEALNRAAGSPGSGP